MSATGEVKATTGVVIAIDESGTRRLLKEGDSVSTGEQVVTGELGSVAIEFDNGLSMDLGRNVSETLSLEGAQATENQINQMEDSVEKEVNAEQQTLLMGEDYDPTDPTTGMEAPGAGPDGAGPTEDDGHSVVQNLHLAPRMTPESGFETIGIGVEFPELPPELIQNPITPVVAEAVAAIVSDPQPDPDPVPQPIPPEPIPPEPIEPEVSIFRLNEAGPEQEARMQEGERANIGYRTDPGDGDIVTKIIISGFPENDAPNDQPDWQILPRALNEDPLDYDVDFVEYSQTSPDGLWQVILDVNGADPGEEIDFLLNTTAPNDVPDGTNSVPLQFQTTVNNSVGGFTSTAEVSIIIDQFSPPTPPLDQPPVDAA